MSRQSEFERRIALTRRSHWSCRLQLKLLGTSPSSSRAAAEAHPHPQARGALLEARQMAGTATIPPRWRVRARQTRSRRAADEIDKLSAPPSASACSSGVNETAPST